MAQRSKVNKEVKKAATARRQSKKEEETKLNNIQHPTSVKHHNHCSKTVLEPSVSVTC